MIGHISLSHMPVCNVISCKASLSAALRQVRLGAPHLRTVRPWARILAVGNSKAAPDGHSALFGAPPWGWEPPGQRVPRAGQRGQRSGLEGTGHRLYGRSVPTRDWVILSQVCTVIPGMTADEGVSLGTSGRFSRPGLHVRVHPQCPAMPASPGPGSRL